MKANLTTRVERLENQPGAVCTYAILSTVTGKAIAGDGRELSAAELEAMETNPDCYILRIAEDLDLL